MDNLTSYNNELIQEPINIQSPSKIPLADSTAANTNIPLPAVPRTVISKPSQAQKSFLQDIKKPTTVMQSKVAPQTQKASLQDSKKPGAAVRSKVVNTRTPVSSIGIKRKAPESSTTAQSSKRIDIKKPISTRVVTSQAKTGMSGTNVSAAVVKTARSGPTIPAIRDRVRSAPAPANSLAASGRRVQQTRPAPTSTIRNQRPNSVATSNASVSSTVRNVGRQVPSVATGSSNRPEWDPKGRLETLEETCLKMQTQFNFMTSEKQNIVELLQSERSKCKYPIFLNNLKLTFTPSF